MTEAEELEYLRLKKKKADTGSGPVSGIESLGRGFVQSGSLGFADEIEAAAYAAPKLFTDGVSGAVDKYQEEIPKIRGEYSAAQKANPWTYGGGALAGAFIPGIGAAKLLKPVIGGMGAIGKAATIAGTEGALAGIGTSEEKDVGGLAKDAAIGGVTGAALGGAFAKAAEKLSRLRAPREIINQVDEAVAPLGEKADDIARIQNEALGNPALRDNADEIAASWRNMGAEAPTYALTKEKPVQNLASELIQSPTIAGRAERKAIAPIYEGIEKFGEDIASQSGGMSKAEAGRVVRGQLGDAFTKATEPASEIYNALESEFSGVPIRQLAIKRSLNRLQKDIANYDVSGKAQSMIDRMRQYAENVTDVSGLKKLRTNLSGSFNYSELTPNEQKVLSEFYDVLTRERNRSILGNFFKEGPTDLVNTSREDAQRVLSELQKADSMWKGALDKFGSILPSAKGASKYGAIKKYLSEETPLEQYVSDLFDKGDLQSLEKLKSQFPEVFDVLRRRALGEAAEKATNPVTGEMNTRSLVGQLGRLRDETTRGAVLGPELSGRFNDVRNVYSSLPDKFNPSETATSLKYYSQMLNPKRIGVEAEAAANRALIRGEAPGASTVEKIYQLKNAPRAVIQRLKSISSPKPYAQLLENALQRGDAAYASTYFLLQQSEPEFRRLVEDNEGQ